VNYEERIERMLQSGVIDEQEAHSLGCALKQDNVVSVPEPKRRYRLESIGAVLLGALIVLIWLGSAAHPGMDMVEHVDKTLNAPVSSDVSTFAMFGMVIVLVAVLAYSALYILARLSYTNLWKSKQHMALLDAEEKHLLQMQKVLADKADAMAQEHAQQDVDLVIETDRSPDRLPQWLVEIEEALLACRNDAAKTMQQCKMLRSGISGALAKLVGTLPKCEEQ
jgi:hypothetical protein